MKEKNTMDTPKEKAHNLKFLLSMELELLSLMENLFPITLLIPITG